jgi:hypothetical protein
MKNARLSMSRAQAMPPSETSRRGRPFLSKFTTYDNEDQLQNAKTDEKMLCFLSDSMPVFKHPEDNIVWRQYQLPCTAVPTPTSNMRRNAGVENMIISQPTQFRSLFSLQGFPIRKSQDPR